MENDYTKRLSEVLEELGYGTEEQVQSLTDILSLMDKFPDFVFNDDIEISMKNLFLQKYDIREICCEDTELFLHFWKERTNELLIRYVPKIQMWLDNFNDLFKFTVRLTISDSNTTTDNTQNTYYLNPVNNSAQNLKVQDVDKSDNEGTSVRTIQRDALQSVWGKTRAALMKQILELKDIYYDCLLAYENIFLGVM